MSNEGSEKKPNWFDTVAALVLVGFQTISALLIAAVLIGLGSTIWNAARAHGLVVEAFVVPDDFAKAGLTGQVLASRLGDELRNMQNYSERSEDARSIEVQPPDNPIKVEVSQAGLSIGEASVYLEQWLSSQKHISGEAAGSIQQFGITARVEGDTNSPCRGAGSNVTAVLYLLANCVYRRAEPFHYAAYIEQLGRKKQALDIYQGLVNSSSSRTDRAWAYRELGYLRRDDDLPGAIDDFQQAINLEAAFALAYRDKIDAEEDLGRTKDALKDCLTLVNFLRWGSTFDTTPQAAKLLEAEYESEVYDDIGDYGRAAALSANAATIGVEPWYVELKLEDEADSAAAQHDEKAVATIWRQLMEFKDLPDIQTRIQVNVELEHWFSAASIGETLWARATASGACDNLVDCATQICNEIGIQSCARLALAYANVAAGKAAPYSTKLQQRAIALIETPNGNLDCYPCLVDRGRMLLVDAKRRSHNFDIAREWFERARQEAPELPFANFARGQLFMTRGQRGDIDRAIADLQVASYLSPHFADPLEYLGEALAAKCEFQSADRVLLEAQSIAPNWTRLIKTKYYVERKLRNQHWIFGGSEAACVVPVSAVVETYKSPVPLCGTTPARVGMWQKSPADRNLEAELAVSNAEDCVENGNAEPTNEVPSVSLAAHPQCEKLSELKMLTSSETVGIPASPRLLLEVGTVMQNGGLPIKQVIGEYLEISQAYAQSSPGSFYRVASPVERSDFENYFVETSENAAQDAIRRGDPDDAERLLKSISPYVRQTTTLMIDLAEATDAKQDAAGALKEYYEAWRSDTGDRTSIAMTLLDKSSAEALRLAKNGSTEGADAVYQNLSDSGVLDLGSLGKVGRAVVLSSWATLLKQECREAEANQALERKDILSLNPDESAAMTRSPYLITAEIMHASPQRRCGNFGAD